MTASVLRRQAASLSLADRIQLVEDLWDDIADSGEDRPLTGAQRAELDRRLSAIERDPLAGRSWDDVKRESRPSIS